MTGNLSGREYYNNSKKRVSSRIAGAFDIFTRLERLIDFGYMLLQYIRLPNKVRSILSNYTHRQKLSNTTFYRRLCFGICRTEYMLVMHIKYF